MPTLAIHGFGDPLVSVSGGLAVAKAILDAKFVSYREMVHDLPSALRPMFAAEIGHDKKDGDTLRREPGV